MKIKQLLKNYCFQKSQLLYIAVIWYDEKCEKHEIVFDDEKTLLNRLGNETIIEWFIVDDTIQIHVEFSQNILEQNLCIQIRMQFFKDRHMHGYDIENMFDFYHVDDYILQNFEDFKDLDLRALMLEIERFIDRDHGDKVS